MFLLRWIWMDLKISTFCNNHSNEVLRKSCFSNISVMTVIGKKKQNWRMLVDIEGAIFISFSSVLLAQPWLCKRREDYELSYTGEKNSSDYLFVVTFGRFISL